MRSGSPVIAIVLLGSACGGEPATSRAELDALLQRLDAMDRRLDALEEAVAKPPAAERAPAPSAEVFAPAVPEPADPETGPSVIVHLGTGGIEIDGKVAAQDDVAARLRELAAARPGVRLSIMAEPDVPHDAVVRLIDRAREAGLTRVAIAARVHGETAPAAP